jgi:Photosynthetic reaction centre cytochrome C subunit
MHSRLLAAGILLSSFALLAPAALGQDETLLSQAPAQSQAHARRPLPKPTNLKVLPKDISPEELVKIMRGYAGSLGVECSFCHAPAQSAHRLDFASDAKPDKAIARIMIQMTHDMNTQYMAQVHDPDATPEEKHVTCGTCHRGHSMPPHFVLPPQTHHQEQDLPGAAAQ